MPGLGRGYLSGDKNTSVGGEDHPSVPGGMASRARSLVKFAMFDLRPLKLKICLHYDRTETQSI